MSEPIRFVIENGEEVTVYPNAGEFTDALIDVLSNNETVNLESQRKGDEVYVTIL